MGYDMYSVKTQEYFRANIHGMSLLRCAMHSAGVDLDTSRERGYGFNEGSFDSKANEPLAACFGSNDGWHVQKDECVEIAEKIKAFNFINREYETIDWAATMAKQRRGGGEDQFVTMKKKFNEDDVEFFQKFAEFCEASAKEGGFAVW